jgi:hypothetical protein
MKHLSIVLLFLVQLHYLAVVAKTLKCEAIVLTYALIGGIAWMYILTLMDQQPTNQNTNKQI